jgi:3-oxoacyl-[acyl-carrier protein] reductase
MLNAIVTGTRKGIGKSIAEHLLDAGWKVAGCSRGEGSIEHANYTHTILDVSDEVAATKMVREFFQATKKIDLLVNNAGIASMNHCLLTPGSTVKSVFETNYYGSFYFLRECAKRMKKSSFGRIVNFSTVAVPLDLEGEAVYASSKAAIESLTRTAAAELAPFGITVNAIGPTPIDTDLTKTVPKQKIESLIEKQPIKRLGKIEDVLNLLEFLIKPESEFITGQVIYLGGVRG